MVCDLSDGPPRNIATDHTVKRIARPGGIEEFRCVAEEALDKDYALTSGELANALAHRSTQHLGYIAYAGAEPACIGRLYTHPLSVLGGLYGGTTLEQYRKQGFYRALVAARAHDAINLGARYLLVDALPTSRPILGQLGVQHLSDTIPCVFPRAEA